MSPSPHASVLVGLALWAVVGAGCADPPQPVALTADGTPRACFRTTQVDSFAARGFDGVNIRTGRDYFGLDFAGACPEISEADRITLTPFGVGAFVCQGEEVNVTAFSKVTGPKRCLARDIRPMTRQEVALLPKAERP